MSTAPFAIAETSGWGQETSEVLEASVAAA